MNERLLCVIPKTYRRLNNWNDLVEEQRKKFNQTVRDLSDDQRKCGVDEISEGYFRQRELPMIVDDQVRTIDMTVDPNLSTAWYDGLSVRNDSMAWTLV